VDCCACVARQGPFNDIAPLQFQRSREANSDWWNGGVASSLFILIRAGNPTHARLGRRFVKWDAHVS